MCVGPNFNLYLLEVPKVPHKAHGAFLEHATEPSYNNALLYVDVVILAMLHYKMYLYALQHSHIHLEVHLAALAGC